MIIFWIVGFIFAVVILKHLFNAQQPSAAQLNLAADKELRHQTDVPAKKISRKVNALPQDVNGMPLTSSDQTPDIFN